MLLSSIWTLHACRLKMHNKMEIRDSCVFGSRFADVKQYATHAAPVLMEMACSGYAIYRCILTFSMCSSAAQYILAVMIPASRAFSHKACIQDVYTTGVPHQ